MEDSVSVCTYGIGTILYTHWCAVQRKFYSLFSNTFVFKSTDMHLVNSLQDIPEFKNAKVNVRNESELLQKLNKLIRDGANNLQIVTDFDHTLTRHSLDNGEAVLTSFGMFRECPSIPQHYKDEDVRLAAIYKPIECDPHLSTEVKIKHMVDWYVASHEMLKGIKFPCQELKEVAQKMNDSYRVGVKDMILWSEKHKVPVLVFSAGLGESVVAALEAANFLLPHVKVVSNFLKLDEANNIVGIKGEIIHTYNKNEAAIKGTEYYEMVKERHNVLLMGDNIGDAGMAEGMEHCEVVIKIGFLGRNTESNLNNYLNKFDIVLVNDSTMDIPNSILKQL